MKNPLRQFNKLPAFSKIRISHIVPALDTILSNNRAAIKKLLRQKSFSWENLITPLEVLEDHLSQMWSTVEHLNSVANNNKLRKIYNQCLPKLSKYHTEVAQNVKLYQAIKKISHKNLNAVQKRVIKNKLRDFKLSGVALNAQKKKQYAVLCKKLSKLSTKFEENVLDATRAWTYHTIQQKQLSGLPPHVVEAAKQLAKSKKKKGWIFTLDFPIYYAVMTYADSRALRCTMYKAYSTRASDQGPTAKKYDNTRVMKQILDARAQLAKLVDFTPYTKYSLATKMAKTPKEVFSFLNDLAGRSKPKAQKEFKVLEKFAGRKLLGDCPRMGTVPELKIWDIAYYSKKLKKKKFSISQEILRPYFSEDRVFLGLFQCVEKLYGIKIKEKQRFDRWHKDVRFFEIYDKNRQLRGAFYADLYARPGKRGGAWMAECRCRRRLEDGTIQTPVAYLNCNFHKPTGKKPSLLTHNEVHTLFHEFGHCLHHLLTTVDYLDVSGINDVPWDAVELPSQFMENFCFEKKVLNLIARHYKTNKKLPDHLYKKMIAAKNFQAGIQMIRQLVFSLFDFKLHNLGKLKSAAQIQWTLDQVRQQIDVMPTPKFNRFQHGFTHIFAGGYGAGYYSYKWAEVLSCDAFDKFKQHGLFNKKVAESFLKNILEIGGSRDMMKSFIKFRGRKPSIKALLRHASIR